MTSADLRPMGAHLQSGAVMLRAERLGRSIPGKVLVAGAAFDVRGGETLAIVGPSGPGKTSLHRLLNRLDEPTSGIPQRR
jgi:ABC-type glutathione transport system ATPase component